MKIWRIKYDDSPDVITTKLQEVIDELANRKCKSAVVVEWDHGKRELV